MIGFWWSVGMLLSYCFVQQLFYEEYSWSSTWPLFFHMVFFRFLDSWMRLHQHIPHIQTHCTFRSLSRISLDKIPDTCWIFHRHYHLPYCSRQGLSVSRLKFLKRWILLHQFTSDTRTWVWPSFLCLFNTLGIHSISWLNVSFIFLTYVGKH